MARQTELASLSDQYKSTLEDDRLGFKPYVKALVDLVLDDGTDTPLTVGVFGPWGSGKTSLMRMVQQDILDGRVADDPYPTVWFDAWKYDKEDVLWRALLIRVLDGLRPAKPKKGRETKANRDINQRLDDLQSSLYRIVEREELGDFQLDWTELAKGVIKGGVHFGVSFLPVIGGPLAEYIKKMGKAREKAEEKAGEELVSTDLSHLTDFLAGIERERLKVFREHITSLEQFQHEFRTLVDELVIQHQKKLIVFVDDLDRCLPEKAVEVLEAIKLFLDVKGCIFVLGIDHHVIARGVEIRYRELGKRAEGDEKRDRIEGKKYLEKIIQLPFQIPVIDREDLNDFVSSLATRWPDFDNDNPEKKSECARVFSTALEDNPRQIKRTVNAFLLLWRLREAGLEWGTDRQKSAMEDIRPVRLAKVVAIQQVHPLFYDLIKRQPGLLGELELYVRQQKETTTRLVEDDTGEATPQAPSTLTPSLEPFASRQALGELLSLHPPEVENANFTKPGTVAGNEALTSEELRIYFTLSSRTESTDSEATDKAIFVPSVILIPEGPFFMGTKPEDFKALGIDEPWEAEMPYHEVFLSSYSIGKFPVTNYQYEAFVREDGYQAPGYWSGNTFPEGKSDHPVTQVSWDDAQAYCTWLREKTGKNYQLPTEAQWEKAARGSDGRFYPWGNEWDAAKLNSAENGADDTTPVDTFPDGNSPYGVADMAGNIWEWCADYWDANAYKNRAQEQARDPEGPDNGSSRVVRGGSFLLSQQLCRCAARSYDHPGALYLSIGFRIILLPFDVR